jgi:2-oxoglutarate ferredoxin oxidoreductase subunit beta
LQFTSFPFQENYKMATEAVTPQAIVMADFKGKVDPDWCPGCGDFGVLAAVQKALVELQIPKHEVATISGIGCSSNFPGFIDTYGMHTLHGRSLPVATGMKMANHAMTVLVTGGDGDGFGIGCGHFVHATRRNVDLLYLVMDNQIYGLTTGQTSPTSRLGMKTKSMPFGSIESPLNPISLALAAGATFVARGFSAEQKHLTELIKQGIEHKGFSFIDVFSPCVTYNHDNTFQWFRPRVKKLEDNPEYDSTNWAAAMEKSLMWGDEIPIGKFFERTDLPTLHGAEPVLKRGPLVQQDNRIPADIAKSFIDELM